MSGKATYHTKVARSIDHVVPTKQYSSKDIAKHTVLKYRKIGQNAPEEVTGKFSREKEDDLRVDKKIKDETPTLVSFEPPSLKEEDLSDVSLFPFFLGRG
jgi:hypothetical protein